MLNSDKKTILVVEDDVSTLVLIEVWLKQENYSVITAKNGIQAYELLADNIPSLIITDYMMPKMSGLDLLEKINTTSKLVV